MARYPTDTVSVASGYGLRRDPKGGLLPQGHWGLDLTAKAGDPVRAPEDSTVVAVWYDDKTPPYAGYGMGGVELSGDGVFHLLGHMDPQHIEVSVGDKVYEGEQIGVVGDRGHLHWEVRKVAVDNPDTREGDTLNPQDWVKQDPNWVQSQAQALPRQAPTSGIPWWMWFALLWYLERRR